MKDFDGEIETFIEYETLTSRTRTLVQQNGRVYIAAVSFGIFALVGFILNFAGISSLMRWSPLWAIASIVFFGFHFYRRRRYLLVDLTDQRSIFFLADKPSKEELTAFMMSMKEARKGHLRKRYFSIDPDNDPSSELEKFRWLLKEGVISDSEYARMKSALYPQDAGNNTAAGDFIN